MTQVTQVAQIKSHKLLPIVIEESKEDFSSSAIQTVPNLNQVSMAFDDANRMGLGANEEPDDMFRDIRAEEAKEAEI